MGFGKNWAKIAPKKAKSTQPKAAPKKAKENPYLEFECELLKAGMGFEREKILCKAVFGRLWRCDYLISFAPENGEKQEFVLEIEGGLWSMGRHTRAAGYLEDTVKYNALTSMGYRVYRFGACELKKDPASFVQVLLFFFGEKKIEETGEYFKVKQTNNPANVL